MNITKTFLIASFVLFIASLFLPAFLLKGEPANAWPGVGPLIFGCMGLLVGQFAWFANIAAVVALLFLGLKLVIGARLASIVAVLLACDSFQFHELPGGGGPIPITGLGLGAYLWGASLLFLLAASFAAKRPGRTCYHYACKRR